MANYLATDTDLTAVADAIRQKGGTSAALAFPAGFVSAVEAISGGGWTMEEVLNSSEYASLIKNGDSSIHVYNPHITSLVGYMFTTWKVASVHLPNVKSWGFAQAVSGNTAAPILVFSGLQGGVYSSGLRYSGGTLTTVDLGPGTTSFGGYTFQGSSGLKTLILRSTSVASMSSTANFNGTPFASGGSGGTLYVPSALIASYQAATNWSTILGYSTNSIAAIEGSIYETQYADGTPIT